MNKRLILVLTGFLLLVGYSDAHDLYLTVENGSRVCAGIGEHFPASESAITPDRLNSFQARTADGAAAPLTGEVAKKQFCAPAPAAGPFIAEMTVQPRFIKLDGKDFNGYIHGEGLTAVEKLRTERGEQAKPGRELYSRYTKLLVGTNGDAAARPLGHALEIVPLRGPSELKPGDRLPVQVLFKGKPLADAQVSAVYAGADLKGHEYPVTTRTDGDGKAQLRLDRGGLWYARLIYMEPAQNDPEVDWRSYFATLTFTLPAAK